MPLPISTEGKGISEKKPRALGGFMEWLLSADHFHIKLFLGGSVGVLVIVVLAVLGILWMASEIWKSV